MHGELRTQTAAADQAPWRSRAHAIIPGRLPHETFRDILAMHRWPYDFETVAREVILASQFENIGTEFNRRSTANYRKRTTRQKHHSKRHRHLHL
jgi:hypothetical protein